MKSKIYLGERFPALGKGVGEGVPKEERPEKMMQVLSFMHHPTEGDK